MPGIEEELIVFVEELDAQINVADGLMKLLVDKACEQAEKMDELYHSVSRMATFRDAIVKVLAKQAKKGLPSRNIPAISKAAVKGAVVRLPKNGGPSKSVVARFPVMAGTIIEKGIVHNRDALGNVPVIQVACKTALGWARKVKSHSDPKKEYTVRYLSDGNGSPPADGEYSCSCPAFQFHPENECKHISFAKNEHCSWRSIIWPGGISTDQLVLTCPICGDDVYLLVEGL